VATLLGSYGTKSSASRAKFGSNILLDPNFRQEAELFVSLKYSKSDRIWTVKWKNKKIQLSFQISDFCKWYGVWPLDSSFGASHYDRPKASSGLF
jgi:hypothetical protein